MDEKKVLLVTGASSDVGCTLIRDIYRDYDRIWAHYNHSDAIVKDLAKQCENVVVPVQADFVNLESTRKFIDVINDTNHIPDHVVHLSAPKTKSLQFRKCRWEDYQGGIDISLRSIVMILQAFMPMMVKKKYGKVVFMLSAYVIGVPPKFQSPYITVKYALMGLMRNLAAEYAGKGISVNSVSPDMMETKFLSDLPELIIEQNRRNNPLGRNITIEEIVPTIKYLLSDASAVVTGQNIGVTGGGRIF